MDEGTRAREKLKVESLDFDCRYYSQMVLLRRMKAEAFSLYGAQEGVKKDLLDVVVPKGPARPKQEKERSGKKG